jgi:hypothetical protein
LKAGTESEIDTVFASLVQLKAGGLIVAVMRSLPAGANSSWRWHHAMPFRRYMSGVNSLPWVG